MDVQLVNEHLLITCRFLDPLGGTQEGKKWKGTILPNRRVREQVCPRKLFLKN